MEFCLVCVVKARRLSKVDSDPLKLRFSSAASADNMYSMFIRLCVSVVSYNRIRLSLTERRKSVKASEGAVRAEEFDYPPLMSLIGGLDFVQS